MPWSIPANQQPIHGSECKKAALTLIGPQQHGPFEYFNRLLRTCILDPSRLRDAAGRCVARPLRAQIGVYKDEVVRRCGPD